MFTAAYAEHGALHFQITRRVAAVAAAVIEDRAIGGAVGVKRGVDKYLERDNEMA